MLGSLKTSRASGLRPSKRAGPIASTSEKSSESCSPTKEALQILKRFCRLLSKYKKHQETCVCLSTCLMLAVLLLLCCSHALSPHAPCSSANKDLAEQQPPEGVFICDHAGFVINKMSLNGARSGDGCILDLCILDFAIWLVQGYLTYEKMRPPGTLP